uniref:Apple domain-containing protein n=1 Tax=viral metagenome TaxID=1070528 RepID=A0A6C0E3E7_9ZZZZ
MSIDNVNAEINSNILDLETLQQQFNTTLQNYNNTYTNYLNTLPTLSGTGLVQVNDVSNVEYIYLQGKMLIETTGQLISISDLSNSDISGCQALCESSTNCTGATFDSRNGKCATYSGDYTLSSGDGESYLYALIPMSTQLLMQLKSYNAQLTNLNSQILSILKDTQPVLDEEIRINNVAELKGVGFKEKLLIKEKLLAEEKLLAVEIAKLLEEQETYSQDKNNTYNVVNSYYTQYKISIFIIFILIALSLVIFSGYKPKLFIITVILSMFFIFKFNILYIILVMVLFKLYKLNIKNKVIKMPYPTTNPK